jgi:hypothetical protein
MVLFTLHDRAGWVSYAENRSRLARFSIELDHDGSFNVLPSRGGLSSYDVLAPGQGQLLQALTISCVDDGSSMRSRMGFRSDITSPLMQSPAVDGGVHQPFELRRDASASGTQAHALDGGLADMLSRLGVRFMG